MRRFLASLMLGLALFTTGCSLLNPLSTIIDIGIFWYEGEANKYYACPQQELHSATKAVLAEFQLPIKKEYTKNQTVHIKAGDKDRFSIKVVSVRQNVSKLSIRINTFGDKPYAEMIFRHVDQQKGVKQFATTAELKTALDRQRR